jgi:hypothetical protein
MLLDTRIALRRQRAANLVEITAALLSNANSKARSIVVFPCIAIPLEVLFKGRRAIAYGIDSLLKLVTRDAELVGPVANRIILPRRHSGSVLRCAKFFVVGDTFLLLDHHASAFEGRGTIGEWLKVRGKLPVRFRVPRRRKRTFVVPSSSRTKADVAPG